MRSNTQGKDAIVNRLFIKINFFYFRLISNSMWMFLQLFLQLFVFSSLLLFYSQDALSTIKKMNPKKNKASFKMNRFPNPARHNYTLPEIILIQICKFSLVILPSESSLIKGSVDHFRGSLSISMHVNLQCETSILSKYTLTFIQKWLLHL